MAVEMMPAGRELDALVAEKVMGWPWRVWHVGKNSGKRFLADPFMEGWVVAQGAEPLHDDAYTLVPFFSSDIAAAWQVVNKMRALGWEPFINPLGSTNWECVMGNWQHEARSAVSDTAQHAICLAALEAVGGGAHG